MSPSKWSVVIFLGVLLLTFASSYFFMIGREENQAAESVVLEKTPDPAPKDEPLPKQDAAPADPQNPKTKPAAAPQGDALLLKRLNLPIEGAALDKDHYVHALALDPTGTRVVVVTQSTTYCLDTTTGKVLQTFRSGLPSATAHPQFAAVSPDARYVVFPSVDGKEVAVRDAATARLIGTCRLRETSRSYMYLLESLLPAFTPAEDFLLIGAGQITPTALHAFSTKTGTQSLMDVPRLDLGKMHYQFLLPVPQWSTFLVYGPIRVDKTHPSNLFAVDFSTGKETPLTSLHFQPQLHDNRPLSLSPDGTLLLVKGLASLEVCDWRNNRLLFSYSQGSAHFVDACFTPDGTRVAVIYRANGVRGWVIDPNAGRTYNHGIDDEVQLFDLASQTKIGSFRPHAYGLDAHVRALAMSHDGRSFAIWTGSEITMIDFEAAFAVAPLPPSKRLTGPEQLPLKQGNENMEPPKKRK